MRVLFVSSGNNKNKGPGTVVRNQGESLRKNGIDVEYYSIIGKGLLGYLSNYRPLRKMLRSQKFDVVHAHYADSAGLATLAGARPLVVSLMGTDALESPFSKMIIRVFSPLWSTIIVKSEEMKIRTRLSKARVVSNGVDLEVFPFLDQMEAKRLLQWDPAKKQVLFLADPNRPEKNFALAKNAVQMLNDPAVELKVVHDVPHEKTFVYYYAADVLLMTSLHEGSPNVIKEGMACNIPIVCTEVGDVPQLLKGVEGCVTTGWRESEVAESIGRVLLFNGRTGGRTKLTTLGLTAETVAAKLKDIYMSV